MPYGNPPNGPYGEQYPQYGEQDPTQAGQYPAYGSPYQEPAPAYSAPYQPYSDPYQPYSDPYQHSGDPQWGQQPGDQYGPPPKGINPIPIIAAAVVAVLLLTGVGVWLVFFKNGSSDSLTASGDSSSTRSSTSRTRTTERPTDSPSTETPADNEAAQENLMAVLPAGFSASNCAAVAPADGALATVTCTASSSGPASAVFSMFADQPSLDRAFNSSSPVASSEQLVDCPNGSPSPTNWTYEAEPDVTAGYVACGFAPDGTPQLSWSKYDDFTMGYIQGPDLTALHDWWWDYG